MALHDPLKDFEVGDNSNFQYDEPPLIHIPCGETVCTLETGDLLAILVSIAHDHARECETPNREDTPS